MSENCPDRFDQSVDRNCEVQEGEEELRWIRHHLRSIIPGLDSSSGLLLIDSFQGLSRIHTPGGLFFFKSLRGLHLHEHRLTGLLAELCPANLPEVIGVEDKKGWLLMKEVKGSLLEDLSETRYFEEAIGAFARLQIACVEQVPVLLACGCPDYRLETLTLNLESFLADLSGWEIRGEEIDSIRKQVDLHFLLERLTERAARIEEAGIPPTLGHGDLNLGNIFAGSGRCIFIDWAEGYVGHPFFTPLEYFNIVKRGRSPELANVPALRLAYLKPWAEMLQVDLDCLARLLDSSRPLGMLRIAMRTWQYYANVESIHRDPEASVLYAVRIWTLVQRMERVLAGSGNRATKDQ